jgi:hypothetical protein
MASNMKNQITRVLKSIDSAHADIYTRIRSSLSYAKKEAPHILKNGTEYIERVAENTRVQEIVIMFVIFLVSFCAFNRSARYFATTDALPNNLVTLNLLYNGRYDLTNLKTDLDERDLKGIYVRADNGKIYPKTSVFLGILGVPFFSFMHNQWGVGHLDKDTMIDSTYSQYIGKLYASFLSAISAILVYIVLRKLRLSKGVSFSLGLIYALCTNVFNIAAQSNIQHSISLVFITGALAVYFAKQKRVWAIAAAAVLVSLSSHIRISNGFYLLFLAMVIVLSHNWTNTKTLIRQLVALVIGAAIGYLPPMLFLWLNRIPNGYRDEILFSLDIWSVERFMTNLFGLLFSYNYGLFIFSPIFLLLVIIFLTQRKSEKGHEYLVLPSIITIGIFVAFASTWWMWSGGLSLGARLIIEAIPLAIILIGIFYNSLRQLTLFPIQLTILIVISMYFNFLTSFAFDKSWHDRYTKPGHESQIRNAWYNNPSLLVYMMQHQFYFNEQLKIKERKGEALIEVHKERYWLNGYDREFSRKKQETIQVLPLPE